MSVRDVWGRMLSRVRKGAGGSRRSRGRAHLDRHYVSEFTAFMEHYLEEHPEVDADRAQGRGMYWDKKLNLEELEKAAEDSVPPEPYSYYSARSEPPQPVEGPRGDKKSTS
jgi:hypothetical protein